ncbi:MULTISPECIES: hypothetical protein [Streptomyces]|uniref:hypothetical protein n=1 Tax=Streptomyces TaxID=1883 RepID=UPI000F5517FA|nr:MULTISPECIES: hypothetical protein [Streptomyces]
MSAGLAELVRLYDHCEGLLGGAPAGGVRERTTGGGMPGLPFNADAADARAAIMSLLGSWSGLVAEQRGLLVPSRTAPELAAFLLANADWLAAHPAAAEATAEVLRQVRRTRAVARPATGRRIRIGNCVRDDCTGELSVLVRGSGTEPPAEIRCDRDTGHTWRGDEWTRLWRSMRGRKQPAGSQTDAETRKEQERWLTAADISRLWTTPVGTVYRLASEGGWRRHSRSGHTYYAEEDAHACFSRRAARSRRRATLPG